MTTPAHLGDREARHRIVRGGVPQGRRTERVRPPGRPSPTRLLRVLAAVYLEVESGVRPAEQLRPLLSDAAWGRVRASVDAARRERDHARRRRRPAPAVGRVVTLRAQQVDHDRWEAAVVVGRGARVGALALRIERHRGVWRCTELHAPERGGGGLRTASSPARPDDLVPATTE